ncbi:hypothetical protein M0813_07766 [Anaeramoeba flamelloides]|uniref:Uncharacterized protein n=1 Tax=Anaeramoeba flamelloides TaxID=1746091 RepID=A0ABQ8XAB3_9EUKA|nr:hypothetical protein M0813_07766 [Anaeramoeba flamelloides]
MDHFDQKNNWRKYYPQKKGGEIQFFPKRKEKKRKNSKSQGKLQYFFFFLISCSDYCIKKDQKVDQIHQHGKDYLVYLQNGIRVFTYYGYDFDQLYVQALDSEGLIGEPVSYTSDLDAVETVRSPAIEWVGDNYFFITYQVSDFDDHERVVAGQLFEAKEDANIELIGDRLEISKSWKNGD